ncbi:MAG: hypothetical protein JW778_05810 [Candidatus Altiarchaeota archaeon]|nr:hypothetical protein [Candidatus Altiarchaeota archaeon]
MAEKRNPVHAAILSFLIAGTGQLYVGKYLRAAVFLSLEVLTGALYIHYNRDLGFVLSLVASLIAAFDAYRLAVRLNKEIPEEEVDVPVVFIR